MSAEIFVEHIVGENGISYTLGEDGFYYPNLCLLEQTDYEIGRYGRMRERFLREERKTLYWELLRNGRLNEHLHETEEECCWMIDLLVEQMKKKQGVTEQLKAEDQMLWVKNINIIQYCAEKMVLNELIYV